jgi:hypothetical protein
MGCLEQKAAGLRSVLDIDKLLAQAAQAAQMACIIDEPYLRAYWLAISDQYRKLAEELANERASRIPE